MLCDFSENFHCRFQKEVMAAHWKKDSDGQVTIYTCVIYFLKEGAINHKSFAIVSDILRHSHREVAFFNEHILEEMGKATKIEEVIVWSDGAASQFKCRQTMVHMLQSKFNMSSWNFFESYHGKGPHDGVGESSYQYVMQHFTITSNTFFRVSIIGIRPTTYIYVHVYTCLLYTSPSPRDLSTSRMPSSA